MDTGSSTEGTSVADIISTSSREVRLPRCVDESFPDVHAILSGSEIARLTRRPRWLLFGMAVLGHFPKQRTHCGKSIGWHRADVLDWLTQHMATESDSPPTPHTGRHPRASHAWLPPELASPCRMHHRSQRRRCAR